MRLIDADNLKKYFKSQYTESKKFRDPGFTTTMGYLVTNICKDIDRQPTISTPHWTPVSEGLPEDGEQVLVQFINGQMSTIFFSALGEKGHLVAWMPLPDPYKEEP